jgi:hypothetical protein
MMSILFQLISFFILFNTSSPEQEPGSKFDEKFVKSSVLAWADSTFYEHSDYKFESFTAFYTEEYTILKLRADFYQKQLADLKKRFNAGEYGKSETEYELEVKKLEQSIRTVTEEKDNLVQKVTHYKILFWSNVKVSNGTFVYYGFDVRLNNQFKVETVKEKNSIGKHSGSSISYKQGKKSLLKVLEK